MKMQEYLEGVVDYIEVSQELIGDLQKKASEASSKPAFSDEALKQTAEKLVKAGVLSKNAADHLVQSFPENPDKALQSLQRCAAELFKRASQPARPLGAPETVLTKLASADSTETKPESDTEWEESWKQR